MAAGLLSVVAAADGWRTSLLIAAAAGAVALTRIRFSVYAAAGVLLIATVIIVGGQGLAT